jgi:predicted nucleic acid-binding protein
MTRYLLDTAFVIDHLRGDELATRRLARMVAEGDLLLTNEVVACEVMVGLRPSDERFGIALLRFLDFVQPGPDAAMAAGRWRATARQRGETLSLADALIAAAAHAADATVLTRDLRDFALTPVRVEAY